MLERAHRHPVTRGLGPTSQGPRSAAVSPGAGRWGLGRQLSGGSSLRGHCGLPCPPQLLTQMRHSSSEWRRQPARAPGSSEAPRQAHRSRAGERPRQGSSPGPSPAAPATPTACLLPLGPLSVPASRRAALLPRRPAGGSFRPSAPCVCDPLFRFRPPFLPVPRPLPPHLSVTPALASLPGAASEPLEFARGSLRHRHRGRRLLALSV